MTSRRDMIATSLLVPAILRSMVKKVPVGLEMYSVREELAKDPIGTIRAVARMGYETVEFYAPYFQWTVPQARQIQKQLNDCGIRCSSTHNGEESFTPDGLKRAIELNLILGSRYIVMAGSPPIVGLAGWRALSERITLLTETLMPLGMRSGFHNHETEWALIEGKRPMDILSANTPKEFTLQFDVGSCVAAGQDPVAWIRANPGRIRSIHCRTGLAGHGVATVFSSETAAYRGRKFSESPNRWGASRIT